MPERELMERTDFLRGDREDRAAFPKTELDVLRGALVMMRLINVSFVLILAREPRIEGKDGIEVLNWCRGSGIKLAAQGEGTDRFTCRLSIDNVRNYVNLFPIFKQYIAGSEYRLKERKDPSLVRLPEKVPTIVVEALKEPPLEPRQKTAGDTDLITRIARQRRLRRRLEVAKEKKEAAERTIELLTPLILSEEQMAALNAELEAEQRARRKK